MYYATYHGLHKWYNHIFEHLGWMVLAKDKGYSTKIKAYLDGIKHFHEALVEAIENTEAVDRITDLKMLMHNLEVLEKQLPKIFGSKMSYKKTTSKRRKSRRSKRKSRS